MKIGGFQPMSLSDFPGEAAAIVFTQGCNFRCPYCHNRGLHTLKPERPGFLLEEVLATLAERRKLVGGVVLTGGEPTLQADLEEVIRSIRRMGFRLKLDTNGSRPWVIERLLQAELLDFVAMDVKAPPEKYAKLAGVSVDSGLIERSMRRIAESGVPHEFRTVFVRPLLNKGDLRDIEAWIPAGGSYKINPFVRKNAVSEELRDWKPVLSPQ